MSSGVISTETMADASEDVLRFGRFTLHPARRVLTEGATRVHLGSRALDILLLLLERAGTFVSKNEIFARVWPTTVVIEGNLRVHVTALRKALGDGHDGRRYIMNVPNRGYSFVAPVSHSRVAAPPAVGADAGSARRGLVAPLNRIVGRDAAIDSLSRKIRRDRLVTVVGAGGIGKTTLALSVATTTISAPTPWTGVHFVDLAPLSEGRLVPDALAAALGLTVAADDARPNILAFLHDKSLLLLLDNCEHVLAPVADLAEAVLRAAPGVHILATSREPLKAEGERIQQLQPLELPDAGTCITAAEAMRFGAIQLFVDRATATLDTYVFEDADVAPVVDICVRLDGLPLAIELAAAFVSSLSVRSIRAALESRFLEGRPGRRTAIPRHRTLRSTIDWSYGLLSPRQRTVLARVSMFCSSFTLESAGAVACDATSTSADVFDEIVELAAKSLLAVDVSSDPTYFRLLETTRRYASIRLLESGELPAMRRRHAEHMLELLRESEQVWRDADVPMWQHRYGRHIDDVRSALAWAKSAEGDVELGIALTARSALLLFQLSRADECLGLTTAALDAVKGLDAVDQQLEFELHAVYGFCLIHTRRALSKMQRSLDRALEIAKERGDPRLLALAYGINWLGAFVRSDTQAMREFARQFESLTAANPDPASLVLCDRMKAQMLHRIGDQRGARLHAERALAAPSTARPPFLSGALVDGSITMEMLLGRVLWLQGLPDQAEEAVERALQRAARNDESVAVAYVLALGACPLAMWTGRLDLARQRVALLLRHTREHSLQPWHDFATAYKSLLDWHERGRTGHPELPDGYKIHERPVQLGELLATLHPEWAEQPIIQRGDAGDAGWCQAELLRVRAERAHAEGRMADAQTLFLLSLERARSEGALSWELRTATSLARLCPERGRLPEALERLRSVLDRFTEGHSTVDVREASAVHDALAHTIAQQIASPEEATRT